MVEVNKTIEQRLDQLIDALRYRPVGVIAAQMKEAADLLEPLRSGAVRDILAERARQVNEEGWTAEHDAEHCNGELATAAACYVLSATSGFSAEEYSGDVPSAWPWDPKWWKPKTYRRDLVRAAALLIAEIERSDANDE